MADHEVLDEKVIHESGSFRRVRRWLRGWHPHLGTLSWGWGGQETVVEADVIRSIDVFRVEE